MEQNLQQQDKEKVQDFVERAFNKGLVSIIICGFPVSSIVSIFLAASSKKTLSEAANLAKALGIELGGKSVATRILNIIGLVTGIVMSAVWGLYILIVVAAVLATMGM